MKHSGNKSWQPNCRLLVTTFAAFLLHTGCTTTGPARQVSQSIEAPAAHPAAYTRAAKSCAHPDNSTLASIVRIATDEGAHGSGVVVGHDRVLTAAHVVVDSRQTQVGYNESFHDARVLAIDSGNDLALLDVSTGSLAPMSISNRNLILRENVIAIGYPLAMDQAITRGEFQKAANGKLYTSAWITAGNSGGGLLHCENGRYELAGILRDYVAYLRNGQYINADQSTSAPAAAIRAFIEASDPAL